MTEQNEEKTVNKQELKQLLLHIFLLSLAYFWLEIFLKENTINAGWDRSVLFIYLFSFGIACFTYFISSFAKTNKTKNRIQFIILTIFTIIFIVNYFVYYEFKIFYDVNTVTAGTTDVLGGFMSTIFSIVFSANGIVHILFFVVPVVLFKIITRKKLETKEDHKFSITTSCILTIITFLSHYSLITNSSYYRFINTQYNYQSAIMNFGLMDSIVLDTKKTFSSTSSMSFISQTIGCEFSIDDLLYEKNIMDIDFQSLEENASNELVQLDNYVRSLSGTSKNEYTGLFKGKNLIFISAEAFSAEVIDEDLTPTLYRLATKGINFTDYYQPASAGTTGGEYENLFGMLPMLGGSSLKSTAGHNNYLVLGNQLNREGYNGWAFHNNDYTYYDRDKTHNNLGYSNGFMGYGNGMEEYITKQWPQSDLEMIQGTLDLYIDEEPFNIYYMSVSGHSNYDTSNNAMSKKNWDRVKNLEYSDEVKGYLAANLELEDALTYLVNTLEEKGIADDTVIVIAADHFPYGLDYDASLGDMPYLSELYGYNVTNYFERDHNRLIVWSGSLEEDDPIIVDTPTSSLDILPTLSNLFDLEYDSRLLPGRDVFSDATPLVFNVNYDWKTDKGTYYAWTETFVPIDDSITVSDSYIETMNEIVGNKIKYCEAVLKTHYFDYLFGNE